MNDWWKMGLAGVTGAGLLAATGGAALPGILGGTGAAGAAGAAGAGATGAGAGAAGVGMLGAGATGGAMAGAGAAAAPGAMSFVTPAITQGGMLAGGSAGGLGAGGMSGTLAGTSLEYGTPAMLAQAEAAAAAAPAPGLLAQAGGYAQTGMKAANTFGSVNRAMGGGQPPMQAPAARPVFQGEQPQISSSMGGMGGGQPAPDQNAVLAAIARRRQRSF